MISRRRLLLGGVGGLGGLGLLGLGGARPDRKLIVILANGGWDVSYALDPKLDVPDFEGPERDPGGAAERVRSFAGIPVAINPRVRPSVGRFFDGWARQSVVVNGIVVGSLGHVTCRVRMLTGTAGTDTGPDMSAIVGAELGADRPVGSFSMTGNNYPGELTATIGQLGHQNQLTVLLRPDAPAPGPSGSTLSGGGLDTSDLEAISAWQQERLSALRDRLGPASTARLDDLDASLRGAGRLRTQADLLMERLPAWSPSGFHEQAQAAITLLSAGSCQSVLLDTGSDWDSHIANHAQSEHHEALFATLDALAQGLHEHALLDQTLVVVLSEMGRAPILNSAGGKDHWSVTSALLFGGGIGGGRVVGATTDALDASRIDPHTGAPDPGGTFLSYASFVAGILRHLGIDSQAWLPEVEPLLAL